MILIILYVIMMAITAFFGALRIATVTSLGSYARDEMMFGLVPMAVFWPVGLPILIALHLGDKADERD